MDVKKVAALAHLEISDDEANKFAPQMEQIVAYIEKLNELNTDDVEASIGGLTEESEETDAIREDTVGQSLGQEKALSEAPEGVEGHFRVPKVL